MKLYSSNDSYKLYHGNMLDMREVIEPNSIDSIVTDPPYELGFMGKSWDKSGIAFQKETWGKCFEVLKPGGYLLVFGGSRTFHRIACAIEDAGFEIRDTIMWLYGSGFPKSMDISKAINKKFKAKREVICGNPNARPNSQPKYSLDGKSKNFQINVQPITAPATPEAQQWDGWGTALKPSFEPIIVARKPVEGTVVNNVLKWGVGGINIDECRVAFNGDKWKNQKSGSTAKAFNLNEQQREAGTGVLAGYECKANENGRFPANTILTYDETDFDEVCGGFPHTKSTPRTPTIGGTGGIGQATDFQRGSETSPYNDSGSAARYFYCAKASKKDRDEGLDDFELKTSHAKGNGLDRVCEFCGVSQLTPELCKCEIKSWVAKPRKNTHPTVKPTELMQYLVRLVTPKGGTILDPFNGSGSTGKAVMYENKERNKNYKYIGIELVEEYLPIAKARIEYVCNLNKLILTSQLQTEKINEESGEDKQLNLFELIGSDTDVKD
jgi:DNA modification methylase